MVWYVKVLLTLQKNMRVWISTINMYLSALICFLNSCDNDSYVNCNFSKILSIAVFCSGDGNAKNCKKQLESSLFILNIHPNTSTSMNKALLCMHNWYCKTN